MTQLKMDDQIYVLGAHPDEMESYVASVHALFALIDAATSAAKDLAPTAGRAHAAIRSQMYKHAIRALSPD
jgi:hypothetical protein